MLKGSENNIGFIFENLLENPIFDASLFYVIQFCKSRCYAKCYIYTYPVQL